jgi:MYXO-CTERM domain-containing protein
MAAISPSGRYVVFRSFSTNLVTSPSGSRIYVRDRQENTTTNMPLPPDASSCEDPRISDFADILAQCNMNAGSAQAFLYKPVEDAFYQLSTSTTAGPGNGASGNYSGISADGAFMVFDSDASDLVPGDTNNKSDVFVAVPEPDAASGWLIAVSALAVAARRRSKRRSR